ncbi:YjgB family protein [Bacillus sp. FJAT-28004]|uniref:YjgB family protein n=1 Tax=Bacillus sp. FJAT-28004 TaxID=1679165 RepID=UPI0006B59382|nr:YjgB family protein [Bacillus sp. FJAT-28004]
MNQTKRFKQFAIGISFAIALSLTACSNKDTGADQAPPPATEIPSGQPETSTSPSPSAQPSALPSEQPDEKPGSNDSGKPSSGSEVGETISSVYKLAKEGKVPGSDYAAHIALYDEIEKKWGKPDTNEAAGKGIYATYKDKGITFGYNKGMLVFDVRSYSEKLQGITLKDIEIALGSADEETVNGTDAIYTYEVNDQYQLKFIMAEATGKVDHISVYCPQDAKNNMAG